MDISALLIDAYDRADTGCRGILEGIDTDTLHARLTENSNSIAWLVWHIAREQDLQIAHLAGREQVWTADGWAERFDRGAEDFGFGDSPEQVAAFRVDGPEELLGYLDAVREAAVAYLRTLTADDLAEVIDDSYDPPVTRGVRIVSIIDDAAQHTGQAAFIRGALGWDAERP